MSTRSLLTLALSLAGCAEEADSGDTAGAFDVNAAGKSIIGITIEVGATYTGTGCPQSGPGALGCWRLTDGSGTTAVDSSGFGTNGTYTNGPVLTGGWAEFDGTNDYVRVPYASSFDIGTADFTLAAWVWQERSATSGVRVLIDHRASTSSPRGYELYLYNGVPGLQLADSAGYNNYNSTGGAVSTGAWHHVVVSVERGSTSGIRFYVDGAASGSAADPTGHPGSLANAGTLTIARVAPSASSHFKGALADVAVYRAAMTASEVASLDALGI